MRERIGLTSYAYFWATTGCRQAGKAPINANDLLNKVDSLDLGVLQICDNIPLDQLEHEQLTRLKTDAQERSIKLEVGARGMDVDYLLTQLSIASILESDILRIVPWSGFETQQALPLNNLGRVIEQVLPTCKENNIRLGIENYFDFSDDDLLSFIQELGDESVGICLDTANSTGFLKTPIETVKKLAPHTISLHLKDFVVLKKSGVGYWITGTPLGQGWLDVQTILDLIKQAGRDPNILIESWMIPKETLEETLLQEETWVRESIDYLLTLSI